MKVLFELFFLADVDLHQKKPLVQDRDNILILKNLTFHLCALVTPGSGKKDKQGPLGFFAFLQSGSIIERIQFVGSA